MRKKKQVFVITLLLILLISTFAGCSKEGDKNKETAPSSKSASSVKTEKSAADSENETSKTSTASKTIAETKPSTTSTSGDSTSSQNMQTGRDKNYLTSSEAIRLAYQEAKKWSEDALFKSITIGSHLSVHYDWSNTDMAFNWSVVFASPSKKESILVYVNYGKVDGTLIRDDSLSNMPPEGHPNDRPLISAKEAFDIAVKNGGIYGIMPENLTYTTYGYSNNHFPCWMIVYGVPMSATSPSAKSGSEQKEEMHYYYINAETKKIAEMSYKDRDNKKIEKSALTTKDQDLSKLAWMQDQRYTVIKFFTLINEGNIDKALEMMDDNMITNSNANRLWKENLSSIIGHEFKSTGFAVSDETSWTEDTQIFEVAIKIPNNNASLEKYGWNQGENTRWITLKKYGTTWKIHEISTSP